MNLIDYIQFASFSDFLQMGNHGVYVWACYFVGFVVLLSNVAQPIIQKQRFFKQQRRILRREQAIATSAASQEKSNRNS